MSKSGEAFEKLTYEEIRSMILKEMGEWLDKMDEITPVDIETLKRGEMPK